MCHLFCGSRSGHLTRSLLYLILLAFVPDQALAQLGWGAHAPAHSGIQQAPFWTGGNSSASYSTNYTAPNYRVAANACPTGARGYNGTAAMAQPHCGACNNGAMQPGYESMTWEQAPCQAAPGGAYRDCGGGYCGQAAAGDYGCDFGYGGGYGTCAPAGRWLGYAGYLMLDREHENHRFYSYDSNNEAFELLDSQDSNFDWASGVEGHLMYLNTCTGCAYEGVYWGLFPGEQTEFAYPADVTGDLNAIFNFDQLDYNGNNAATYVDGPLVMVHRLRRNTEIHNAELNHIWSNCCGSAARPGWVLRGLVGFRYFRFVDNLEFASDTVDTVFTGAVEELYYNIDCTNDLYGVQFGALGEHLVGSSPWSFTFGAKAGVFCNSADARSRIGGAAGPATINNGPNVGATWDISSSKEDVATIAELQAGIAYRFSHTWRVRGEYRVIGVSGVALPTNQIYQDLRGIQDVGFLSTNGDLILHGLFAGIERLY